MRQSLTINPIRKGGFVISDPAGSPPSVAPLAVVRSVAELTEFLTCHLKDPVPAQGEGMPL
ncbi:hypothetical protein [Cereibacter changlensis]|uniref:hypothetical protein n=1 Tax=Cereibacter changlensis TaxID=402884 RepID=UPI00403428A4